ncbi:diacylglycerol/lipid kinase family protein [Mariniluteicoccus flavus]
MTLAAVAYNPVKVELDELKAVVAEAEQRHGWEPTLWLETSEEDPGVGRAKEAIERGADMVIAAGGDGTVRAVAQGLRDSGVRLALLPAGTGNLLARNLNLTLADMENSIETAFGGDDREIDLGVATLVRRGGKQEEHAFLVMAGLGLDAQMISNSDEELKKKVGTLAYVKSIAESLKHNHRMHLTYALDDQRPRRARVHTIMVGNCGSLQGNILLLPDAAVDDGVLDVVAFRPEGPFGWLQVAYKVLIENAILRRTGAGKSLPGVDKDVRTLNYQQCRRMDVHLRGTEEIELDGDHFGEVTAFRAAVDAGALKIRVPKED